MRDFPATGLDHERWHAAHALARDLCDRDVLPAMGLAAGRAAGTAGVHLFGRQEVATDSPPIREDAIFLIASITKPIVGMAALLLVERGTLGLADRVSEYLPEFGRHGKAGCTVRHLLTHTSGLPDMLPENRELRATNAPLSAFVEATCALRPDFSPGRGVQYQSMGFAVLGEIIARVSGRSCADFLREEIFVPLGMRDTALGAPDDWFHGPAPQADRIAEVRLPEDQRDAADWHWNTRYWRTFGAPWGGLLTTPADLARFARMMLNGGRLEDVRVLSPAAVAAATCNQLSGMEGIPAEDRERRPWGLGWRFNWPAHASRFGDLLGPRAYGHNGATGTLLWIDPDRDAWALLLSTQPQPSNASALIRLSNAVAAAFV